MDWFSPIDPSKKNSEFIAVESKSFWKAAWGRFKKNPMAVLGLVVILLMAVISIFGPMISPYAYDAQDAANQYAGFSAQHIFGTDKFGRDVFTRLCYGGRISLAIGFGAAVINTVLGVVIGGLCGYIGGKFDNFVMRIVEMIFQILILFYHPNCDCTMQIWFVFYSFPTITARSSSVVCISSFSNQIL